MMGKGWRARCAAGTERIIGDIVIFDDPPPPAPASRLGRWRERHRRRLAVEWYEKNMGRADK